MTLTKTIFEIYDAGSIFNVLFYLDSHRDKDYPNGYVGAKFDENRHHYWLNTIRATNLDIPNEVVSI